MPAFQTVPYIFVGGTYQSRTSNVSSQRSINMYQQINAKGKAPGVIYTFPGQRLKSDTGGTIDRGMREMDGVLYRIVDNNLYSVSDISGAATHNLKGVVPGSDRCIMSDDGENLVIVCADGVYTYNITSDEVTKNDNVNLVGVQSVTVINNQFIYTTKTLSFMSQPYQPNNVSGLDAIGAESNPDKLVRDYAFNQTLYRFGTRTTEPWYNTTTGNPPIARIDGQQFSIGLSAIHSLVNTDNALYWLGDDNCIYRVAGGIKERISDDGISNSIEQMGVTSDAFAYTITLQGQDFYIITFPSANKTFAYNESLGEYGWFELRSYADMAYSGTSAIMIDGTTYLAKNGKLMCLDINEYTQDNDLIVRERIGSSITRNNAPNIGVGGRAISLSRLELVIESGVGLVTGQGDNPKLLVEFSTDGGETFQHSQWLDLGRLGNRTKLIQADVNIVADDIIPKITITDPVNVTIISALIDIKAVRY